MSIVDPIAPLGFYCGYLGKEAADPDAETESKRQKRLQYNASVSAPFLREHLKHWSTPADLRDYTGTGRTFVTGPVTTTTPTTSIEDKPWYSRWMQRLTPAELDSYAGSRDAQSWKDMEYAASQGVPYAKQYLKNNPKPKEKGKILDRDLAKRVRILSMPLPISYGAITLGRFIILNSADSPDMKSWKDMEYAASQGVPYAKQYLKNNPKPWSRPHHSARRSDYLPHELTHVSQQAQVGTIPMALKYISDYARNRRHMPIHAEAYDAIPAEMDAVNRDEKWRKAEWADKVQYMHDAHRLARARQLKNSGKPPETGYMTNYSMESGIPTSERIYNPLRHYPRLNEAYRELFSRPGKISNRNEQAAALARYKRWKKDRFSEEVFGRSSGLADQRTSPYPETRRTHRRLRRRDDDRLPGQGSTEVIKRDKYRKRLTPGTDYPEYSYSSTHYPVRHRKNPREDRDRYRRLRKDREQRAFEWGQRPFSDPL